MGFWVFDFLPKPLTRADFRMIIGKSGLWREEIPGSATIYLVLSGSTACIFRDGPPRYKKPGIAQWGTIAVCRGHNLRHSRFALTALSSPIVQGGPPRA
jgi:hypothetical protein